MPRFNFVIFAACPCHARGQSAAITLHLGGEFVMFIDAKLVGVITKSQEDAIKKYDFEIRELRVGEIEVTDQVVAKFYAFKDASKKGKYVAPTVAEALKAAITVRDAHDAPPVASNGNGGRKSKVLKAAVTPKTTKAAPKPAKAAVKATKAATPKAESTELDWEPMFPDNHVLTLLVKESPRRPGTMAAENWALYRDGMTIAALRKAGGCKSMLVTDVTKNKSVAVRKPKANGDKPKAVKAPKAETPAEAPKADKTAEAPASNVVALPKSRAKAATTKTAVAVVASIAKAVATSNKKAAIAKGK